GGNMSVLASFIGTKLATNRATSAHTVALRCASVQATADSYLRCRRATRVSRPMKCGGGNFADSIGTRLIATSHEARCAIDMAIATWVRKMLIWFLAPKMLGRNTTMLVNVPAAIAMPTTWVPCTAQCHGLSGYFSRYW